MISIKELKKQIGGSDELKAEVDAIKSEEELAEFLKKNDCDATPDEFRKYYGSGSAELDDEELDAVAGGKVPDVFHFTDNKMITHATCAKCGGRMEFSYMKELFLTIRYHYVCTKCNRIIWRSMWGTTGVSYQGD